MRELVAALEQIRTRILYVITALEEGDERRAMLEVERAAGEWADAIGQIRA